MDYLVDITDCQKHVKCHYDSDGQCQRCKREGEECVRERTRIRFRHGSRGSFHTTFAEDQPWVGTGGIFQFVNETAGVVASYLQQEDPDRESDAGVEDEPWGDHNVRLLTGQTPASGGTKKQSESSALVTCARNVPGASTPRRSFSGSISCEPSHGRNEIDRKQPTGRDMSGHAQEPASTPLSSSSSSQAFPLPRYRPRVPSYSAPRTPSDYPSVSDFSSPGSASAYQILQQAVLQDPTTDPFWDDLVKRPARETFHDGHSRLQAVLLRYYAEEIADRFDLCDPERHFARVVPQRARSCPPLLNAIFTTSARHLTRLPRHRHAAGAVEWRGSLLPDLTEEVAVYYHNECIRDLLRLSVDPEQIHDENLLAAATILRTDEEMDSPLRDGDGDQEVFLQMLNIFINAQVPAVTATSHQPRPGYLEQQINNTTSGMQAFEGMGHPHPAQDLHIQGLRQAVIRVALRQELFTSYMKHRPLKFPPFHYEPFRGFSPADDTMWAHRLVIFCADVLQYCYGANDAGTPHHSEIQWQELKRYGEELRLVLPESFAPIFYRPPNIETEEIFPEIWYLQDCHVTGMMHAELARLLLAVYNPTRPRLGHGYAASMRELTFELQKTVLRLCGIALSNRQLPSVFIEALMGISTYGEYFEDRRTQAALLGVLDVMHEEHAYPTAKIVQALKEAWGWV
ncbi:transcriptional regulator family: Fungal Specific TF [Paecilomyces variotii]|nr:transcriptional regulator family: Fungal Specific TF [Paecilomyces variotii]KAJ9308388.1 transcriptional regulator family: Fungal Specific TF [Paecilomyces variotii]